MILSFRTQDGLQCPSLPSSLVEIKIYELYTFEVQTLRYIYYILSLQHHCLFFVAVTSGSTPDSLRSVSAKQNLSLSQNQG